MFIYECGNYYSDCAKYLSHFRELSDDPEKKMAALWGKLAAEILIDSDSPDALKDLNTLKEQIELKTSAPLIQLHQRTWLIHWSLFIYFPHATGRTNFVEWLFTDSRYMNTIQTACPHLLRYLTAAVVTSKKSKSYWKNLVEAIEQENFSVSDPITEFVVSLFVKFDFEAAQQKLKECETVLQNDYFLKNCKDEFIENARLFIFETYCKIHSCIDINMLSKRLDMNVSDAERWIVNLIRDAKLDAKIDSAAGTVIISSNNPSVYQQLIEKTKQLSHRAIFSEREHTRAKHRTPGDKNEESA